MKRANDSRAASGSAFVEDDAGLSKTFTMMNRNGLHARPCALITKTLRPFRCQVEVRANGAVANGHSIMSLMALAAAYNSTITFTILGEQAGKAMAAVQCLFDTKFEEAYE